MLVTAAVTPLVATAQTPTALLDRALAEAARIRDPGQHALVLGDIAQTAKARDDARWEQAVADAVSAAGQIEEPVSKTMAWRGLAVRMWPVQPALARQLLDRALKSARDLPYAAHRALTLREIARSLTELDRPAAPAIFTEALAAAEKIESPLFRSAALRDLASAWLTTDPAQADKTFSEAAAALAGIQPPDDPVQLARVELIVAWSTGNLPEALEEADGIADERLRETCYRRVVEALAATNGDAAMQVAAKVRDPGQRALALAAVAQGLAASQVEAAVGMARSALSMGGNLPPEDLVRLQSAVALTLARVDLKESLELTAKIEDETVVGQTMGKIAVLIAGRDPAAGAQIAAKIDDWDTKEEAQAQIAPLLAAKDLPAALALIDGLLSRRAKVHALLQVLKTLPLPAPAH